MVEDEMLLILNRGDFSTSYTLFELTIKVTEPETETTESSLTLGFIDIYA